MTSAQQTALVAAMLVTFVTGSIHSFSVLLVPIEGHLQLDRGLVSLVYSIALIFLTVSVLFGYKIYSTLKPGIMVAVVCSLAAIGLIISASAKDWWILSLGYSVIFGAANGMAYGYVLQYSGKVIAQKKGFAMALVTASYAVGSIVFSFLLGELIASHSYHYALTVLAVVVAGGGLVAAVLLFQAQLDYQTSVKDDDLTKEIPSVTTWWWAYGTAVFAGLMAIGHAAGIVQATGADYQISTKGAVSVGIGSALGGFYIGSIIAVHNARPWLIRLTILSAISLGILAFSSSTFLVIGLLSITGFAYGALISVYPFAISIHFGDQAGPKAYGKVFTAWGTAGLAGPWLAGALYQWSNDYLIGLLIAAVCSGVSAILVSRLPQQNHS